jgi:hypothetical protein
MINTRKYLFTFLITVLALAIEVPHSFSAITATPLPSSENLPSTNPNIDTFAQVIQPKSGWSAWISSIEYVKGANPMASNKPTTFLIKGVCTSSGKLIQIMKNTSSSGTKYPNGMRFVTPKLKCNNGKFNGNIEVTGNTKMEIFEEPSNHSGTNIAFKVGMNIVKHQLLAP